MELSEIINLIKENNITSYQIAQATDLTQPGIDKILNGDSKNPRKRTLETLNNYLITKLKLKNESYTTNAAISVEYEEQLSNKNGNVFVELPSGKYKIYVKKVPVKAFGSYLSDFQDSDFYEELEQVSFTVEHFAKGNYIAFEVQGNSMNGGGINDAPEGAELLCRELGRHHWKDGFKDSVYGWVVVHNETVIYKDIKEVDMNTGEMTLASRSGLPQHKEFQVSLNDVRQIWKVIKRSF